MLDFFIKEGRFRAKNRTTKTTTIQRNATQHSLHKSGVHTVMRDVAPAVSMLKEEDHRHYGRRRSPDSLPTCDITTHVLSPSRKTPTTRNTPHPHRCLSTWTGHCENAKCVLGFIGFVRSFSIRWE